MKVRIISFTDTGEALARDLARDLRGEAMRCGCPLSLDAWTRQGFETAEGLIYVGAAGIAVRAVAPYVRSKTTDPAVVVVDETGRFVISLLSGHLGGANELTERVAALCGGAPVITTATDRHGVFAVDSWARTQGCIAQNPEGIQTISSRLLAGESITMRCDWAIEGEVPEGVILMDESLEEILPHDPAHAAVHADVASSQTVNMEEEAIGISHPDVSVSVRPDPQAILRVIPRIAVIGIGCKRGTRQETIERVFARVCADNDLSVQAVCMVCSIDRKAGELGLVQFCEGHGWTLVTYSAEELRNVAGTFESSAFVQETVGVDNVCERSAVLGSDGGELTIRKATEDGVTMAVALRPFRPNWNCGPSRKDR